MSKSAFSALNMLVLLLVAVFCIATVTPVWITTSAQPIENIVINADGSVDPTNAPIKRNANTYVQTGDISGQVSIERDNIVFDGAGYTIQHSGYDGYPVYMNNGNNITIQNVYATSARNGIMLQDTNNSTVTNTASDSGDGGFGFYLLENCSENIIAGNNLTGINISHLPQSNSNTIVGNKVISNYIGIVIAMQYSGQDSNGNLIVGNQIENNSIGLIFELIDYDYYSLEPQVFYMNNRVYGNNFVNNTQQVQNEKTIFYPHEFVNIWDNGTLGNFWSDYNGSDVNHDGVGDTPYVINGNTDHYPLMAPVNISNALSLAQLPIASPSLSTPPSTDTGSWTQKNTLQVARGRLGVAAVNGKIYAIGGDVGRIGGLIGQYILAGTSSVVNTTEQYDPATGTWMQKAPMPTPRDHFGVATYENKIYCIGGIAPTGETGANQVYDPATDTWENKAPMPVTGRFSATNTVGDKIYVIGTLHGGNNNLTQVYDPKADSWTTTSLPHQIWSAASAVVNNRIYCVAVGLHIQIYDPETDTWSAGALAPADMKMATACVGTGVNAQRSYFFDQEATYVYDTVGDCWSAGASMLTPRGFVGVAVVDDAFYVVGGITFPPSGVGEMAPSAANEQYTPAGYGTPDSTYQTPLPSPTSTPSATPTAQPTTTAKITSSPVPTFTEQPTLTSNAPTANNNAGLLGNLNWIGAIAAVAVLAIAAAAIISRKRKTA